MRANDVHGGLPARLHRGRGHARHERAVAFDVSQVADDVDIVVAGDRQVGFDQDAARVIERHAERLCQRAIAATPAAQSTVLA